jgi:hypothetical protein
MPAAMVTFHIDDLATHHSEKFFDITNPTYTSFPIMLWVEVQGGSTMLGLNGKEIKARMATNNTSGIRLGTIPKFTRFLGCRPCRATCILRQSRYDYVSHQKTFLANFMMGFMSLFITLGLAVPFKNHPYTDDQASFPPLSRTSPWHGIIRSICHSATFFASRRIKV